ncbi:RNA-binding domain superfamily [Arabidopsis thaliana x Arabidopsis arenosa]|uniref:RNA-binding domain superfamily n=1 Tax=Arabidopsis thaliana x Arabidopsis arenosa TaxID=1240361 RepID=A0A8T1YSC1_9BRAS|nr:RNA-binding domain superfamily [Arabidopsis thaliana x Arabidopsis arenosa]
MEESAIKGLKLLELNDNGAKPRSTKTTISVEGYDTRLREYTLKLALEKHFASCGKITTIYVPRDYKRGILKNVAFMWIKGDDAEEKALQLSGTDVGGWTAIVKPAPWQKEIMDPWCPAMLSKHETQRYILIILSDLAIKLLLFNNKSQSICYMKKKKKKTPLSSLLSQPSRQTLISSSAFASPVTGAPRRSRERAL